MFLLSRDHSCCFGRNDPNQELRNFSKVHKVSAIVPNHCGGSVDERSCEAKSTTLLVIDRQNRQHLGDFARAGSASGFARGHPRLEIR